MKAKPLELALLLLLATLWGASFTFIKVGVETLPPLTLIITREDGKHEEVEVLCRIDTLNEVEYFKAGGILHYVLRQMITS